MKINRTCKVCGNEFIAIKTTQFFCRRKCFKRDFYLRKKAEIQDEDQHPSFPIKKCSYCEERSQLTFDPMKDRDKFDSWSCPHCGVTNKLIWEYQNNSNSYQIIGQLIATIKAQTTIIQNTSYQFHTYKLPIPRLEQGNPSIVVMTCEMLSIQDLQRKNRRKITFS